MQKNKPLREEAVGKNPSAYSLIVIRCRKSYAAKVCFFLLLAK